jgi:hypothetical protein
MSTSRVAELIDSENEEKRVERTEERAKVRAEVRELARLEVMIAPLDHFANVVADGAMLAAGYHRTNGGPWGKRRVQTVRPTRGATSSPGTRTHVPWPGHTPLAHST